VLSGEETNTNFLVFGMTRPGLELTIYCTRGEHANHYITDAVFVVTEKLEDFLIIEQISQIEPPKTKHRSNWCTKSKGK
jgi:hypothetical protein